VNAPILPGAVLGVFGGGQLGRMFTLAARRMGYRVSVFAPEDDTPAGQIAYREVRAPYEDVEQVERFAREVDAITFEFENVPAAVAEIAGRHAPVRPFGALLHTTQDRCREKQALVDRGIPVAPFAIVDSAAALADAAAAVGFPAVLKTASWGYDGHGQRRVRDREELDVAYRELGAAPAVLERFVSFRAELSVVGVRGLDGAIALYEPFANQHRDHILDVTLCPAPLPPRVHAAALEIASQVLTAFDVVGVLCVEMFWLDDDSLLVNELAPRPHNSGHLTIDAHECCQFEQQVRAVCALPLGSTARKVGGAAMANLLGSHWLQGPPDWRRALTDPGVRLHLYGKTGPTARRKMGHLTVGDVSCAAAERRVLAARAALAGANKVE
jgi:5-(carboxyamino)imidazole ribonucleotide synthase